MSRSKKADLAKSKPADLPAELAADSHRRRTAIAWYSAAVRQAETGDREALTHVLEAHAAVPSLRPQVNILQDNAIRGLLNMMVADKQLYSRKMIEEQLETMRRELAGDHPSPLDALMVNRIVLCWLQSMHADMTLTERLADGCSLALGEFYQRRAERAQRQLLRAVQTHATVRRLLSPILQVNVAEQQVNVTR